MKLKNVSKRKYTLIALIVVVFLLPISMAFAYIVNIINGWGSEIKIGDFQFRLNGEIIGNEKTITLDRIILGDMYNLDMELAVESKASSSAVKYTLDFEVTGELARAVEVYKVENAKLKYQDMLDKYDQDTIIGYLGPQDSTLMQYRLVYSAGAPEYYDNKTLELRIVATPEVISPSQEYPYYFVSSENELFNLSKQIAFDNATIVFMSDIALTDRNIEFEKKVSIDLKNHQLDLGNYDLNFRWTDNYDANHVAGIFNSYEYPEDTNYNSLNLIRSTAGKINIETPNDIMLVSDTLVGSFANIHINSVVIDLETTNYLFNSSALVTEIEKQLSVLSIKLFRKNDPTDSLIDCTKDLYYYFLRYGEAAVKADISIVTGTNVLVKNSLFEYGGRYKIHPDYDDTITWSNSVQFLINCGTLKNIIVAGTFKILGTAPEFLAEYYMSLIPDSIKSSYFLTTYDALTKTHISWRSYNEQLFNSDGVYLPYGTDVLKNWEDQSVIIGLTLTQDGVGSRYEKILNVEIYDAKERTDRVYNGTVLILSAPEEVLDLLNDVNEVDESTLKYFDDEAIDKSLLVSVKISLDEIEAEKNKMTSLLDYIEIIEDTDEEGVKCDQIKLINQPYNANIILGLDIEFTYINNGDEIKYTLRRNLTIVGEERIIDLKDPTNFLLRDFLNNPYMSNEAYEFYVKAYTDSGVKVLYELEDDFDKKYMKIENSIYLPCENDEWKELGTQGYYVLIGDDYEYISTAYRYMENPDNPGEYIDHDETDADIWIFSNGAFHNISKMEVCRRVAKVTIYPALVPCYNTVANIKVNLLEYNGELMEISYRVYQNIKGIYHNIDTEIRDYYLYNQLLTIFDKNKDGYITVEEAEIEANQIPGLTTTTIGGTTYKYLNFTSNTTAKVSSIKGIEYFINIPGLSFYNNTVVDLGPLKDFYKLEYLNMGMNKVTSLEPLMYLDSLEILMLNNTSSASTTNNNVTDLTPIEHLPNIRYLDLAYNETLTSLSALENYQNLYYIKIHQNTSRYLVREDNMYYLLLLYGRTATPEFYIDSLLINNKWSPIAGSVVAALVLSKVVPINEVYTSLYVPGIYYYQGEMYKLTWDSSDRFLVNFVSSADGSYTIGYNIMSPVVDRDITLSVKVVGGEYGNASIFSRAFKVRLLQSQMMDQAARIEIEPGVVKTASEVVPDSTLRSLLFQYLNTVTSGVVIGSEHGNDYEYDEYYTLSYYEIAQRSYAANLPFDFKGITDLTGLEYFKAIVDLNLNGNNIKIGSDGYPDLRPLSHLTMLNKLTLSGQLYDFSHLSTFTTTNPEETRGIADGLTSLSQLFVTGCYDLDDDKVLKGLYQVYLANKNVSIYLTNSTSLVWNPYTIPLGKHNNSILSHMSFLYKNSDVSFFTYLEEGETIPTMRNNVIFDEASGRYFYDFVFYDVLHVWFEIARTGVNYTNSANENTVQGNGTTNITYSSYYSSGSYPANTLSISATPTGIRYVNLATYTDNFYISFNLYGYDYSGRTACISLAHYTEIFIEKPHYLNVSYYVDKDGNVYDDSNGPDITGNYYKSSILLNGGRKITTPLLELFPGRDLAAFVITHLNTYTTANIALYNLENQYACVPLDIIGTLYHSASTYNAANELDKIPTYPTAPGTTANQLLVGITISSVLNGGTTSSGYQNALTGLYLIRRLTRVNIDRDCNLGDGSELRNVIWLEITNSVVDLSKIRYELSALRTLYIGRTHSTPTYNVTAASMTTLILSTSYSQGVTAVNFYDRSATEATLPNAWNSSTNNYYYYFNWMPNLILLEVVYANCYDWNGLKAFQGDSSYAGQGIPANQLKYLSIFGSSATDVTGKTCVNKNNVTLETSKIVDGVMKNSIHYNGLTDNNTMYFIGTVQSPTLNPATTTTTLSLDHPDRYLGHDTFYGGAGKKPAELYHTMPHLDYNNLSTYIQDLGMRINDEYYFNVYDQIAKNGDEILLPLSTLEFFGSHGITGADETHPPLWRNFAIEWKIHCMGSPQMYEQLLGLSPNSLLGTQNQTGLSTYTFDMDVLTNFDYRDSEFVNASDNRTDNKDFKSIKLDVQAVDWDVYFYFTGTIGVGYYGYGDVDESSWFIDYSEILAFDVAVTNRVFCYPLLIKGTADYATNITDSNLLNAGFTANQLKSMGINRTDTYVYYDDGTAGRSQMYNNMYGAMSNTTNIAKPIFFSYLAIEDPTLRFNMFNTLSTFTEFVSNTSYSALPGVLVYGNASGDANIIGTKDFTALNIYNSSMRIDFTTSNYKTYNFLTYRNFLPANASITTLNGCQIFTGLTTVRVSYSSNSTTSLSHVIYSCKGLELARNLTTLTIARCTLVDISDLAGLPNLVTVDLSYNLIDTIALTPTTSVFDASAETLTTLVLSYNYKLSSKDVRAMRNLKKLTRLNLYSTIASNEFNTILYLEECMTAWGRTELQQFELALSVSSYRNFTITDIRTIVDYMNPDITTDEVIKKWFKPEVYGDYVASLNGAPALKQTNVTFLSTYFSWDAAGKIINSRVDGKVKTTLVINFQELTANTPFTAIYVDVTVVFSNSSAITSTRGFVLGGSNTTRANSYFGSDNYVTIAPGVNSGIDSKATGTYYCFSPGADITNIYRVEASEFDPVLYCRLVELYSSNGYVVIDSKEYYFCIGTSDTQSFSATTSYGLTSLMGLDKLFIFSTISIFNNPITRFDWNGGYNPYSRLTTIYVGTRAVLEAEDVVKALATARGYKDVSLTTTKPNLTNVDFSQATGLNYMQQITDTNLLLMMNRGKTIEQIMAMNVYDRIDTLAKLLVDKMGTAEATTSRIGSISINNEYNYHGVYMSNGNSYAHYDDYKLSPEDFLVKYAGIYSEFVDYDSTYNNAMYYTYVSEELTTGVKVLGTEARINQFTSGNNTSHNAGCNIFTVVDNRLGSESYNVRYSGTIFDLQYKLGTALDRYNFFFSPVYRTQYYVISYPFSYYDTDYYHYSSSYTLINYLSNISGTAGVVENGQKLEGTSLPAAGTAADDIGFKRNSNETYEYRVANEVYMFNQLYKLEYEYSISTANSTSNTYVIASTYGINSFTAAQQSIIDANVELNVALDAAIDDHFNLKMTAAIAEDIADFMEVDEFYLRYTVRLTSKIGNLTTSNNRMMKIVVLPSDILAVEEPKSALVEEVIEVMEGGQLTLVPASKYIKSPRFVNWLFNLATSVYEYDITGTPTSVVYNARNYAYISNTTYGGMTFSYVDAGGRDGYPEGTRYLSKEMMESITYMRVVATTSSSNTTSYVFDAINDFEGLQLFINLEYFQTGAGYVTSIAPLANMKLTTLYLDIGSTYSSYGAGVNNTVFDFSPLYSSKDTLRELNISQTGYSSRTGAFDIVDLSFIKMFSSLNICRVNSSDYSSYSRSYYRQTSSFKTLAAWIREYSNITTFTVAGVNYLADQTDITADDRIAASVFNNFIGTSDLIYENGFELVPNRNMDSRYKLPTEIDVGGEKFPLSWVSMSEYLLINNTNSTVKIVNPQICTYEFMHLVAQVNINGYYYDMMFTIRAANA